MLQEMKSWMGTRVLGIRLYITHTHAHPDSRWYSLPSLLFIIHRDIKPGKVLVWSLHPDRGVDVRLADYGVSQFSTPSGLWRHKGTEEYMAPELFKAHRNQAYDEKVGRYKY